MALGLAAPTAGQASTERPNVVVVITDDQGYGDLGFTGNPVLRTPNIDAMAARSARLTNFYVSPVCAPTRACLMTGRYNYRTRVDRHLHRPRDDGAGRGHDRRAAARTPATRPASSASGTSGDCYPMRPMDQGFQESLVHRGGGIGQPSDPIGAEAKLHRRRADAQRGARRRPRGTARTSTSTSAMQLDRGTGIAPRSARSFRTSR